MKRILLLSDINSAHTQKWVMGLVDNGFSIGVVSTARPADSWFEGLPNFQLFVDKAFDSDIFNKSTFRKISFLKQLPYIKKVITEFKPDIIHAHYASSYGLLGALSGFHPFFISVWGSDVYEFPDEGIVQRMVLKYNLSKADRLFSTSHAMIERTRRYTSKSMECITFGVDATVFRPSNNKTHRNDSLVIGTVKTMEAGYGIEYLVRAFALLKSGNKNEKLKLMIVGGGSQLKQLQELTSELNLSEDVIFTGSVAYHDVVKFHNLIDIAVYPSVANESFGVSVLEASACERPVVVTDVDGFKEIVRHNETGLIVPRKNIEALAGAIQKLIDDKAMMDQLGKRGREHVTSNYSWNNSLQNMIDIYNQY